MMTDIQIAAEKLGAMIRIPTVSKHEHEDLSQFYLFHQELEKLFPLTHQKLEKTVLNGTLVYRWEGADKKKRPILFMGHQDVVPASDEGWSVPAFSGVVKDGCLYGRGALDCKSTMYVELQAVEELLSEGFVPPCDVYLEYSINEETGGDGAAAAMRYLRDKGIRFAFVLDEGGAVIDEAVPGMDKPYAVVGVTEKGYMDVKITARGKGGHSSTPPRNTPAARLYAFANEIERKRPFKKKMIPEVREMFRQMAPAFSFPLRFLLGNLWLTKPVVMAVMPKVSPFGEALMATTCCFTMMKGSDAANVIPKEPYLIANLRCSVHQNCEESLNVLKKYGKKYDLEFEVLLGRDASPVSDIHSAAYGFVEKTIRAHFPDAGVAPYLIMGGTDCRHFHALTDTALRFAPVRMTNAQNASCHAVDENVTLSALVEGVQFYKRLLKNYTL
ncbi:MAG: M20/M25/M40 family metallo-hydrolase [Ruminococcaceae bacterium]|nr:M20/M25/M40 family metallo-hydrolase [Oscillospiraceae bacterium]